MTILLIEDNPITLKMFRVALRGSGYTVLEAPDGRTALELLVAHSPDIVLQDLHLPDMEGFDLIAKMRQLPQGGTIPILALSGFMSKLEQARSLQIGFTDYLFKPVQPSRLLQVVATYVPQDLAGHERPGRGKRVVLADDDPIQRKLMALHLERLGFQVIRAETGQQALEQVSQTLPDALVSDILMPNMDGFRLCLTIRQTPQLAKIPVLLISSSYTEEGDRKLARDVGADALVLRTPDYAEMIKTLLASLAPGWKSPQCQTVQLPTDDYTYRTIRELERQVNVNVSLARRLAMREAELSILASAGEPFTGGLKLDRVLTELLMRTLNAAGVSKGAVYLYGADNSLVLSAEFGYPDHALKPVLTSGSELVRVMQGGQPGLLAAAVIEAGSEPETRRAALAASILATPITSASDRLGVVVLASATTRIVTSDWFDFAKILGSQFGHTIALTRTFTELKTTEAQFRGVLEFGPDAMVIADSQGHIQFVNIQTERLFGYTRDELIGQPVEILVPDRLRRGHVAHRMSYQAETHSRQMGVGRELWGRRKNGTEFPVEVSLSPLQTEERVFFMSAIRDISVRKEAEAALRTSEERYRSLTAATSQMVWTTNGDGLVVEDSSSWRAYTGQSWEQYRHWGWTDALHPEDRERSVQAWRKAIKSDSVYQVQYRLRGADGCYRYFLARGMPVRGQDGTVREWVGACMDITDREIATRTMTERTQIASYAADIGTALTQNRPLSQILHACTDAMVHHIGAAFARIWVLNAADNMLELTASSGIYTNIDGRHARIPVGQLKVGLIAQERKSHLTNSVIGDPRIPEQEWAKREGLVAFAGYPLIVGDRLIGVMGMFAKHPLSESTLQALGSTANAIAVGIERVQTESALRQSEENFRQLAENSTQVFWMYELSSQKILYVGPAYEIIWGSPCETVYLNPLAWTDAIHPDDRERVKTTFTTYAGVDKHSEIYRIVRPDGTIRWIHDRSVPIRDNAGMIYRVAGWAEDITERKVLEEQLRQAQKMEAIGLLAGGIAHDFNNLLCVITGYAELLLTPSAKDRPARGWIQEIKRAGDRAASLTRQLLAFSRQQVLDQRVLSLNCVVTDMEKFLIRLIDEDIHLNLSLEPSLGFVKADPGQLEQVIMNLCVNARDAMPNGGQLVIQTRNVEVDTSPVSIQPDIQPGSYIMLSVKDTGCGMDEQTRARIFEPFFTTKEPGKGTGLGLATVYGIIQQSEGAILVESTAGHGSTFNVYLPRIQHEADAPEVVNDERVVANGSETILLVEDAELVRIFAETVMQEHGYSVLTARNGEEAIDVFKNHQGRIDLMITDLIMPGMNGLQLSEHLKAMRPEMNVLYMSGYTDKAILKRLAFQPGMPFLQKPFGPDVLLRKIRELLERR
jgi:PAS domain S-box-containing protein